MSYKISDNSFTLPLSASSSSSPAARESKDKFGRSLDPLDMPSPGAPVFFYTEETLSILDHINHLLDDNIIGFNIDPTPIAERNIQVVQELHIGDDPTWKRDTIATDVITLLSQKKRSGDTLLVQERNNNVISPLLVEQQKEKPSVEGKERATSFETKHSPQQRPEEQQSHHCSQQPTIKGRFRNYQAEQWFERFNEMIQFRSVCGHCYVTNAPPSNPHLAQWVKRQRYQYKLKYEGKHSTLTDEREAALEQLGFVWDSHGASWMERWNELAKYRKMNGDSNVKTNYSENRQLSIWVKCQRRQYRLYQCGGRTNMTPERIRSLEALNFAWNPRGIL
jgi:hypothetical protein